jgi:GT2 family glycosyltransferase
MIDGEKIGVGIATYNRPESLQKLVKSVKKSEGVDLIIIVNDGEIEHGYHDDDFPVVRFENNPKKSGVGKSKNSALRVLFDSGYDHIFLIEDDMEIVDHTVFKKYIEASKTSGIQHFNYSQHGMMNKTWPDGEPEPVITIDYKTCKVPLYRHCVGAFSYYSKKCLETVGLLDEQYYNACEHVDHTYEIIKAGMHPPFWYFADIENSQDYFAADEWSLEQSTISSNPNHSQIVKNADAVFVRKHGHLPGQTPLISELETIHLIKQIRDKYA